MRGTIAQKLQRVATVPVIAVIEPRVAFPNSGFDPAEASEPEIPNLVSWW
jgi:hypothetical protein